MTDPALEPLDVIYIVGKGRSGSTLLDDLLGAAPGVTSMGEVTLLWDWGLRRGHPCACGQSVADCDLWGPVIASLLSDTDPATVDTILRTQERALSWWAAPRSLLGRSTKAVRRHARLLGRLYEEVARTSGDRVLVDSSKWPLHPGLLGEVPGVRPWVIHLVRDPRAVAHSYRRAKPGGSGPDLPRFGAVHSGLSWDVRNMAVELMQTRVPGGRFQRVRYEDLASAPAEILAGLEATLPVEGLTRLLRDDRSVDLGESHLVGGNPRRFARGTVEIRLDERWRTGLPSGSRCLVGALTAPLRRRYGYAS